MLTIHKTFPNPLLLMLLTIASPLMSSAQNISSVDIEVAKQTVKTEDAIVYENSDVDVPATYPGGTVGLMQFIAQNLLYPSIAVENGVQGTVVLRFKIDENGSVNTIHTVKSLSPECDKAAIDVVAKLKRFVPAQKNGKNVAVWYILPIRFKLG